jgi:hypothetical protein
MLTLLALRRGSKLKRKRLLLNLLLQPFLQRRR